MLSLTRFLARRLDRLRHRLDLLAWRVRDQVAEAVGRALGGLVRDAVRHALDTLATVPSAPQIPPPRPACRPSDFVPGSSGDNDADPDDDWAAEDGPFEEPAPSPASSVPSRRVPRWATAVAAGLRAAGWLLPRPSSRRGWLAASAAAVLVGGVGYLSPPVAAAALALLGTAQQLGLLSTGVQAVLT